MGRLHDFNGFNLVGELQQMERGKKTKDVEVRALTNYVENLIVAHAKSAYERGENKQPKSTSDRG